MSYIFAAYNQVRSVMEPLTWVLGSCDDTIDFSAQRGEMIVALQADRALSSTAAIVTAGFGHEL